MIVELTLRRRERDDYGFDEHRSVSIGSWRMQALFSSVFEFQGTLAGESSTGKFQTDPKVPRTTPN